MVTIPASQTKHFPKNMVQLLRSPRYLHGSTVPPPPSDRDKIKEKEFHRGEVSSPCEPTTQVWTSGRVPALPTAFPSAIFCALLASAAVATAVFDPVTDVGPVFLKCVFLPPIPPPYPSWLVRTQPRKENFSKYKSGKIPRACSDKVECLKGSGKQRDLRCSVVIEKRI